MMTKYAKKILEIVESSNDHLTAEQIFMQLRETYPTVVLATVYNNLNRLWEENLSLIHIYTDSAPASG